LLDIHSIIGSHSYPFEMFDYLNKTALITGASSGIGEGFARELAKRGMNLILAARSTAKLEQLAAELSRQHGIVAHVLTVDLSKPDAAATVASFVAERALTVDLLLNNAGFLTFGLFENCDPATEQNEIQVNCAALVALTHAFLPGMLERGRGGIINVASLAGFQPIPYMAVYAATKAFIISFSVALAEEVRERGVTVVGLCPGTTTTELFTRAVAENFSVGNPRTVAQVVATGLRALDKRKSLVVDGFRNRLLSLGPRLVPRWYAARVAGAMVMPPEDKKKK